MGSGPGVGRDTNLRRLGQFEPNARRGKKKKKRKKNPVTVTTSLFILSIAPGSGNPMGLTG